ncbi:hypothetical protein BDR05DRAFT_969122 [Suillus weaverae]|nr:hypothetical protein BDR05DRAFT_969122 [Suillus weaverae]
MQPQRSGPPQRHNPEPEEQPGIHREHHQRAIRRDCKCKCNCHRLDEGAISSLTGENAYVCTFMIRYMRQQSGVQVQIKASRVKESAFSMEYEILPIQSQVSTTVCSCISPPLFITIIFPLSRHPPTVTNVLGVFHESSTVLDSGMLSPHVSFTPPFAAQRY